MIQIIEDVCGKKPILLLQNSGQNGIEAPILVSKYIGCIVLNQNNREIIVSDEFVNELIRVLKMIKNE